MRRVVSIAAMVALLAAGALADDGALFVKNIPKTPELESEHARLQMLKFYVPAQTSDGSLPLAEDGVCVEGEIFYDFTDDTYGDYCRGFAKPLVALYQDGHVDFVETAPGFGGHGERDMFAGLSLDDGATWKKVNLSDSARFSSIKINGVDYPGDVINTFAASGGNKVLAVWASRFCQSGAPTYAIDPDADISGDTPEYDALIQMGVDGLFRMPEGCTDGNDDTPCLYLDDLWAVSGSQRSFDMGDEGYPEVGELPYACLWAARGTLEPVSFDLEGGMAYDPDGEQYGIIWRAPERLTSGRRDVNRIEAAAVPGAGFVVTWQEDPEGLRPGLGEGSGSGFSGAIAHNQTDIWYSYLPWEAFGLVDDGDSLYGNPLTLDEYFLLLSEKPKVGIPMSIPLRVSDNAKCDDKVIDPLTGELKGVYCHTDFDGNGTEDLCELVVDVPTKTDVTTACVTEDGRLLRGNVAATRPRTNLRGYDSDGDGANDSAWVVIAAEESKGLGEEADEEAAKVDMGKNAFYYTFDMFVPEFVSQGLQLNQPAVYPDWAKTSLGDLYLTWEQYDYAPEGEQQWLAVINFDPLYDGALLDSTLYQSEISRRTSLITQPAANAGGSGMVGLILWKQGTIQRGGPADVMARRVVIPADFDPTTDNPFAYANVQCSDWAFIDGTNPRYVKGLCKAPALNLSGTTVVECRTKDGTTTMGEQDCVDSFPWNDRFDDFDSSDEESFFAWMTFWRTCEEGVELDGYTCADSDIDDQTWDNPFDLSKGHRGFMDGDFISLLYAWAPNWKSLIVGHDNYNLYARRSFDGGVSWTTTPATLGGDGTTHCEDYRDRDKSDTEDDNTTICHTYGAGEFEQARDLSRFQTVHLTVLDPRFTPTSGSIVQEDGSFLYPDDERDHSKFVITYETGDNTTTAAGEPEPLDMFYGRAYNWGDDYELFIKPEEEDPENPSDWVECAPEDLLDPLNICSFDWLEFHHDVSSSEAVLRANPAGNFFYAVWAEAGEEEVAESDIGFRRIMWYFEETPSSDDPQDWINHSYQLSVNVGGIGSGYVLGEHLGVGIIDCGGAGHDCQQTLAEGEVVDLWAYPDLGSVFEGWQGDFVTTDPSLQFSMTEDRFLTAIFQLVYLCSIDDLVITDMLCTEVDLEIACRTILVQGESLVTGTGALTMVAGQSVAIDNGFTIQRDGQMEVKILPDL